MCYSAVQITDLRKRPGSLIRKTLKAEDRLAEKVKVVPGVPKKTSSSVSMCPDASIPPAGQMVFLGGKTRLVIAEYENCSRWGTEKVLQGMQQKEVQIVRLALFHIRVLSFYRITNYSK